MRLTNHLNLPEPIVRAVENDGYSRGASDISITQLIDAPRIVTLAERFRDELEEDASDRIWSLVGQCIHSILERAELEALTETRLFVNRLGWIISGAFDRMAFLPNGDMSDYKVTSTYVLQRGGRSSWEPQLNLLAHFAREHGYVVDKLSVVAILRDWRKNEARRDSTYPQKQIEVVEIPMWEPERAEAYLIERVTLHQAARRTLPLCGSEDMWARPAKWAVMKEGRKSAVKLCYSEEEAQETAGTPPAKGIYIEHRPGERIRCDSYCPVRRQCQAVGDGQWDDGTGEYREAA